MNEWADLADDELAARLAQRGAHQADIEWLIANRETADGAALLRRFLER